VRRARSITGRAEPAFSALTRSWNWQQGQSATSASAPLASASATRVAPSRSEVGVGSLMRVSTEPQQRAS
jgi:hypothetical protein